MAIEIFQTITTDNGSELNFGIDEHNNLYVNNNKVITENRIVLNKFLNAAIIIGGYSTFGILIVEIINMYKCI